MFNLISAILVCWTEVTNKSHGQTLKAAHLGVLGIIGFIMSPKYALFVICLNFFGLANGFLEVTLDKLPILLVTNIVGWILCYKFANFEGDEGEELVKFLFHDSSHFTQIALCYVVCLIVMLGLANKKYKETKIFSKYHETLISLNKELELANEKLKRANKELKDALQEKENFILRFSHEIRNPLNSLLGNIELCYVSAEDVGLKSMLTDAKVSGEILLQLLNNILDTAKVSAGRLEISAHAHNIRKFVQRAWVICSEIIYQKGLYGSFAVNVDVPEILEFDHHRMMQILINMVSNATKFTDHGYVKMFLDFIEGAEIKPEHMKPKHSKSLMKRQVEGSVINDPDSEDLIEIPKCRYEHLTATKKHFTSDRTNICAANSNKIEIPVLPIHTTAMNDPQLRLARERLLIGRYSHARERANTSEGYIRLEIVDSGRGIKEEDLKFLFEKFKQVDSDASKRQIGTGLGLWITKEIIGLMDGDIEIHSVPNQGTVLVLMLKSKACLHSMEEALAERSDSLIVVQSQPELTTRKQRICKRVLVVEDIPYNQEINRRMLEKCDVENIMIANNGLEALELFKEMGPQYFDLILMDIDMPVMDGKEATKKIRQFEKERGWAPTNLVFLTGFAEAKTQKELLDKNGEYRANNFISKPASLDMIMSLVRGNSTLLSEEATKKKKLPASMNLDTTKRNMDNCTSLDLTERKTVLLVDDDSFNLTMMKKMLEICGFETIQAKNGEMALELYEKFDNKIDIILMDCEMPVMDGLEAAKIITEKYKRKESLLKKELKIYGVTGHIESDYKEKCFAAGMLEVLEKPITTEKLKNLLVR